mmetsp:Transcript_23692/g.68095  ORF Transcript_23692/g.68095 Transcript_23692/m.68095 type:complete len:258 (+) Transcript_23692:340-1113(+)
MHATRPETNAYSRLQRTQVTNCSSGDQPLARSAGTASRVPSQTPRPTGPNSILDSAPETAAAIPADTILVMILSRLSSARSGTRGVHLLRHGHGPRHRRATGAPQLLHQCASGGLRLRFHRRGTRRCLRRRHGPGVVAAAAGHVSPAAGLLHGQRGVPVLARVRERRAVHHSARGRLPIAQSRHVRSQCGCDTQIELHIAVDIGEEAEALAAPQRADLLGALVAEEKEGVADRLQPGLHDSGHLICNGDVPCTRKEI